MSIPKVAQLGSALMQYANSANPTKSSSMMDFILNNNEVLVALASKLLFQPNTAYEAGDFIISDSMQNGLWAKCTTAGTTDTTEPTWGTKADDTVSSSGCIFTMVALATSNDLSKKVDKVAGKGLSTEDYTTADKTKLSGVAEGAEANVIEVINLNGTPLVVANKAVNVDLSEYATKSDISHVYKYMGSVATYADLPATGQEIGYTYNVQTADTMHDVKAGDNLAWNGTEWDSLGGTVDLSNYYTKAEVTVAINAALANYPTKTETDTAIANSNPYCLALPHGAGLFNFSIINGTGVAWKLSNGVLSTSTTQNLTLPAGTSYLYCNNLWASGVQVSAGSTGKNFTGNLSVFSNLTYYLILYDCSLVTGNLSSVSNLTYYLSLSSCSLVTGNLSSVSNLTYYLSLSNCSLVTGNLSSVSNLTYLLSLDGCSLVTGDLSSVSNLTYYLSLNSCPLVTGVLSPKATLSYIDISYTGVSSADLDTLISNLNTITTVTSGTLKLKGLTRTSASTTDINALITKGWSVTDATVVG